MTIYANKTAVSVSQTEGEIRGMLLRYGASAFATGWLAGKAYVLFEAQERRIRFELAMPTPDDPMFTPKRGKRSPAERAKVCEQEHRARWRALSLVIKAKLESVATGIESFEEAFLAHIVTNDGATFGQLLASRVAEIATSGRLPPMLGSGK